MPSRVGCSPVWRDMLKVSGQIIGDLKWQLGNGEVIRVGKDKILGIDDSICLSNRIMEYLKIYGITTLKNIRNSSSNTYWLNSIDLELDGDDATMWDNYINALCSAGCTLTDQVDRLLWNGNVKTGNLIDKTTYDRIMQEKYIFPHNWWYKQIWKWNLPLKIKCFLWHALQGTLKTWDNLLRRGWCGPNWCILCKEDSKNINHLFVFCSFGRRVWNFCCTKLTVTKDWEDGDFGQSLLSQFRSSKDTLQVPIFISWALWYFRNLATFQGKLPEVEVCGLIVLKLAQQFKAEPIKVADRRIGQFSFMVDQPILFFDGAAQQGLCVVGGVIFLNEGHYFTLRLNCGIGSNMKVEVLALQCVLKCANIFGLVNLKVFGDSRVTIKWAAGEFDLNVLALNHWCLRTREEIELHDHIIFSHIFREHNGQADSLSKKALLGTEGFLVWEEWMNSNLLESGDVFFF